MNASTLKSLLSSVSWTFNERLTSNGEILAVCPYCDADNSEKRHMSVSPKKEQFYCYKCGARGQLKKLFIFLGISYLGPTFGSNLRVGALQADGEEAFEERPMTYQLYWRPLTAGDVYRIKTIRGWLDLGDSFIDYVLSQPLIKITDQSRKVPAMLRDRLIFHSEDGRWATGRALPESPFFENAYLRFYTEKLTTALEPYFKTTAAPGSLFVMTEGPIDALLLGYFLGVKAGASGGIESSISIINELGGVFFPDSDQKITLLKKLDPKVKLVPSIGILAKYGAKDISDLAKGRGERARAILQDCMKAALEVGPLAKFDYLRMLTEGKRPNA